MVRFLRVSAILAIVGLAINWFDQTLWNWALFSGMSRVADCCRWLCHFKSFTLLLYVAVPIFLARNRAPWMCTAIAGGMRVLSEMPFVVFQMANLHVSLGLLCLCSEISWVCECAFWGSLFVARRRQALLSRMRGPILACLVLSSLGIFFEACDLLPRWLLSASAWFDAFGRALSLEHVWGTGRGCIRLLFQIATVAFCLQLFLHVRETVGEPLRTILSFGGRLRRRHFWLASLAILPVVAFQVAILLKSNQSGEMTGLSGILWGDFVWGPSLALVLVSLAMCVRRFHDQNLSGGWVVLFDLARMIPFAGPCLMCIELFYYSRPGTVGPNRFGPDPRGREAPAEPSAKTTEPPVPTPIEDLPESEAVEDLSVLEPITEPPTSPLMPPPAADRLSVQENPRPRGLVAEDV